MAHAVRTPNPPRSIAGGALVVHQIPSLEDNFIWLVVSPDRKEAAAVDGPEAKAVLAACDQLDVRLTTILNTHTHFDHIGINTDLGETLTEMRVVGPEKAAADVPGLTEPVSEGDRFDLFGVPVEVLLTEGHIDGHVSYRMGEALFCGDTLFAGGCGYLFDGPPSKMHDSLQRLAALPPETLVFCAHEYTQDNLRFAWFVEPDNARLAERIRTDWAKRERGEATVPSSIGLERATNPFIRADEPTIRKTLASKLPDRNLERPEDRFAAARALKDRKDHRALSDADLPL